MKCYKHNYEHGYDCPHCEQERHNKAVEGSLEKQNNAINQQIAADKEARNEARREAENKEREQAQIAVRAFFMDFIPAVHKLYGEDFVAKFYLRLTLKSDVASNSTLVSELIRDIMSANMSSININIIQLQSKLKSISEEVIDKLCAEIKKEKEAWDAKINLIWYIAFPLLSLVFLVYFINATSDWFFLFKPFVWIFSFLVAIGVGAACTSILIKLTIREKNDSEWWFNREIEVYKKIEKLTPWLQGEREKSEDLINSLSKGSPFLFAKLKEWNQNQSEIVAVIESEINSLRNVDSLYLAGENDKSDLNLSTSSPIFVENIEAKKSIVHNTEKLYCMECGVKSISLNDTYCSECGVASM